MIKYLGAAAVAMMLTFAGTAGATTTITFDDGEAAVSEGNPGLVTHGMHFGANFQVLTGGSDRALLGAQRLQPVANNWGNGGGTFELKSMDLKLVDHGGGQVPTTLYFRYWKANPADGDGQFQINLDSGAYGGFQTIDFSFLGAIRALDFGIGGADVINTPSSPCYVTTPCIWNGNYTLVDNITVDNVVSNDALGVPEPATWAMMIAGLGLAGTALRRHRRSVAAA
jgi:hypothetical protein